MSDVSDNYTRPVVLRLLLPCDLSAVRPATVALRSFLAEQGVPGEELVACELALAEACNNAIAYTTEEGRNQRIAVEAQCSPSTIDLRVTDHTPGFDWPEQIALPTSSSERGRGIFLIDSLVDRANYLRGRGENCLVMTKSRNRRGHSVLSPAAGLSELNRKLAEGERVITDMAEELSSCYESLSAIFRYSAEQRRAVGLADFAHQLLTDLLQITSADWYLLRLIPEKGPTLVVFAASDTTLQLSPLTISNAAASTSIEVKSAVTRRDVWFEQPGQLSPEDPLGHAKRNSVGFVHPISFGDSLMGTLTVGKSASPSPFTAAKVNVVHTFADFLAIQIVNSRFQEERVNTMLVARDLEIARNIQRSLLLKRLPQLPGFDLAGYCESARQVGGDFYDIISLPGPSLLLVIADVMGNGIPAAMFAAILRSLVRAMPDLARSPSTLLSRLNGLLFEELSEVDMFITAQLAFVDPAGSRVIAASAGHCPMLLAHLDESRITSISPEGMPLGILPDTTFCDEVAPLPGRSRLLLYTDGLTEARNPAGEQFGQERLTRWFQGSSNDSSTADRIKTDLIAELHRFQSNQVLSDDQTFLILSR
ncbi:MAG TPA: SpoIIE family protein phosphatase [Candidatus Nitrosotalea sp.]|nr:SpoIIE family protein phosphatase [Candidatus Nitrosotalea sp.]